MIIDPSNTAYKLATCTMHKMRMRVSVSASVSVSMSVSCFSIDPGERVWTMHWVLASRPGLLPPQSITIHTRMLRTLITRGCFFSLRRGSPLAAEKLGYRLEAEAGRSSKGLRRSCATHRMWQEPLLRHSILGAS